MDDFIDYPLLDLVEQALASALTHAADRRLRWCERHGGAKVAAALIPFVEHSERLRADIAGAAVGSIDHRPTCRELLDAFEDIVPREDFVRVTIRLMQRAEAEGYLVTLRGLLFPAVRTSMFFETVTDAWMLRTLGLAGGSGEFQSHLLTHVLRKAVRLAGAAREWIHEIVEREPQVLCTVPEDVLLAIHVAHPTVEGWRAVASRCGGALLPVSFGDRHGEAVDSLREADATAPDTTTRAVLGQWLSDLVGR